MNTNGAGRIAVIILALVVVSAGHAQEPVGANLLGNPGFEASATEATDWWGAQGAIQVDATVAHTGTHSLRFAQTDKPLLGGQTVGVEPGKTYRVTMWVKCADVRDAVAFLVVERKRAADNAGAAPSVQVGSVAGSMGWTRYSAIVPAAGETSRFTLCLALRFATSGQVWFDDLAVEEVQVAPAPEAFPDLGVTIENARPGNIFDPGEAVGIAVKLANESEAARTVSVSYEVTDYHDRPVAEGRQDVALAAKTEGTARLDLLAQGHARRGYFVVAISLTEGERAMTEQAAFGVVEPPPPPGGEDSFFGMWARPWGPPGEDTEILAALERIGVKWLHFAPHGDAYCTGKDSYRWEGWTGHPETDLDQAVERLERHHFEPVVMLICTPPWMSSAPPGTPHSYTHLPANVDDYADYVHEIVRRYKGRVSHWAPNFDEPAGSIRRYGEGGFEHYVALMEATHAAAKRADPDCVVLGCETDDACYTTDKSKRFELSSRLFEAGGDAFDAFAFHPYSGPRNFGPGLVPMAPEMQGLVPALEHATELAENAGSRHQVWPTAIGWSIDVRSGFDSPEARSLADYMARTYVLAKSVPGVKALGWYCATGGELKRGKEYCVFRNKWLQPLPGAVAYANLVRLLTGTGPCIRPEVGPGVNVYVFERGEGALAALWAPLQQVAITLRGDAGDLLSLDVMGNPVGASGPDGLALALGDSPMFVLSDEIDARAMSGLIESAARDEGR